MNARRRLITAALSLGLIASAACRGGETPPPSTNAPASTPAAPTEPVFKPIDPAAPVTLPAPNASTAPPTSAGGTGEPTAMVTDLASGWPINLRVGQAMTARLTADKASGARWSLRPGSDGGVVTLAGSPAQETPVGGPAVEVFLLVAAKPGKTTLTFDLRKGADAALKSASYPVTVE
jgi:predicted secreted protein